MRLRAFVVSIVLLSSIPLATSKPVFEAQFTVFENNSAYPEGAQYLENGEVSNSSIDGNYTFELVNNDSETIWTESRPVRFLIYTNPPTPTERLLLTVRAPYNKTARSIVLDYRGESLAEINLENRICVQDNFCSPYCSGRKADIDCTCGDGVCQSSTNERELCLQDCRETASTENNSESSSETQEINGSGESSAGSQADEGEGSNNFLIYGLIGVLAFLLILIARKVRVE